MFGMNKEFTLVKIINNGFDVNKRGEEIKFLGRLRKNVANNVNQQQAFNTVQTPAEIITKAVDVNFAFGDTILYRNQTFKIEGITIQDKIYTPDIEYIVLKLGVIG